MKKISLIVLLIVLICSGCSTGQTGVSNEKLTQQLLQKENEISEYKLRMQQLEDRMREISVENIRHSRRENVEFYTKKLRELFTEKELKELAKKHVSYELQVNDQVLNRSSITLSDTRIEIMLIENFKSGGEWEDFESILPPDILELGRLQSIAEKNFQIHLSIQTDLPYEVLGMGGKMDGNAYGYMIQQTKPGMTIKLKMSKELAQRLGKSVESIDIQIK